MTSTGNPNAVGAFFERIAKFKALEQEPLELEKLQEKAYTVLCSIFEDNQYEVAIKALEKNQAVKTAAELHDHGDFYGDYAKRFNEQLSLFGLKSDLGENILSNFIKFVLGKSDRIMTSGYDASKGLFSELEKCLQPKPDPVTEG